MRLREYLRGVRDALLGRCAPAVTLMHFDPRHDRLVLHADHELTAAKRQQLADHVRALAAGGDADPHPVVVLDGCVTHMTIIRLPRLEAKP